MITVAKKGNQVKTITSNLKEAFLNSEFEVIDIEFEYKDKKASDDAWMERFGN